MKGKGLSILFFLILFLLSVSACSSGANSSDVDLSGTDSSRVDLSGVDSSSIDPVVGNWEYIMDLSKFGYDNAGELRNFFDFSGLSVAVELELGEDETFSMYYDNTSIENYFNNMRSMYKDGLPMYIEYLIERDNGNMTVEEALEAAYGMTIDEMADMLVQQVRESVDFESFSGSYWTSGDELHLLHNNEKYNNVDEVFLFECDGNALILEADDIDDFDIPGVMDKYQGPAKEFASRMTFTRKP